MLKPFYHKDKIEAGCDEAGRGCLAGPVFAAAVILPLDFKNKILNDSKLLSSKQRYALRDIIEKESIAWSVAKCSPIEIDKINILNASFKAMHRAINGLSQAPDHLLIDGNRFNPYKSFSFDCIVKGDSKFASIAAASVLAKTYRDDYMKKAHKKHPHFDWASNKGYPTPFHRSAILKHGPTSYHRKSFRLYPLDKQGVIFPPEF